MASLRRQACTKVQRQLEGDLVPAFFEGEIAVVISPPAAILDFNATRITIKHRPRELQCSRRLSDVRDTVTFMHEPEVDLLRLLRFVFP